MSILKVTKKRRKLEGFRKKLAWKEKMIQDSPEVRRKLPKDKKLPRSRLFCEKCFKCPAKIKSAGVPVSIKMVV
jgi:hypothetical protein